MLGCSQSWVIDEIQRFREGNNLEVKIYKKQTHTGQYIHYTSKVAPNIKASVITAWARRTTLVCTKNDYLAEELQYIKITMMLNSYSKSFIGKDIKNIEKDGKYS